MFYALCILLLLGFATKKLSLIYPTMFSLKGYEATREVPKGAANKAGKLAGNTRTAVAFDWIHLLLLIASIACSSEWPSSLYENNYR